MLVTPWLQNGPKTNPEQAKMHPKTHLKLLVIKLEDTKVRKMMLENDTLGQVYRANPQYFP